jgi:hypothetical protein
MIRLLPLACVLLVACAPGLPDLDSRISPEARAADYPTLQSIGTVLARADALLPRDAALAGTSLEARAADLRRRAAALRRMPL